MASTGVAVVDFGTGTNHATVTVTGQIGILAASTRVEAWLDPTQAATPEHNVDEHIMASSTVAITCSAIVDNTSFIVNAVSNSGLLFGRFNVAWAWV